MNKKICNSLILKENIENSGLFTGYASVFNVVDSQNDIILQGAFNDTINMKNNIKLLWQHKYDNPIGNILALKEDNTGLLIVGQLLLSIQKGNEAHQMLKSGIINALSIGYQPIDYYTELKTGTRILKKIALWEVSLVTFPSNDQARVITVKHNTNILKESIIKAERVLKSLF